VIRKISPAEVRKREIQEGPAIPTHDRLDLTRTDIALDDKEYTGQYCDAGRWLDEGMP
jgi:hypothetical protein